MGLFVYIFLFLLKCIKIGLNIKSDLIDIPSEEVMDFSKLKNVKELKKVGLEIFESTVKELNKLKDFDVEKGKIIFNKEVWTYLHPAVFNYKKPFDGRLSRRHFWIIWLFSILLWFGVEIVRLILPILTPILNFLYLAVVIVLGVMLIARRFHDINLSAWWILLALIPYVGFLVVLLLCALKGDTQSNTYGGIEK